MFMLPSWCSSLCLFISMEDFKGIILLFYSYLSETVKSTLKVLFLVNNTSFSPIKGRKGMKTSRNIIKNSCNILTFKKNTRKLQYI